MASGDTLIVLTPQSCTPPETVPATLDVIQGADSVSKESFPVLDFDAAQDEYMDWFCVMPENYGGGGITATIVWAAISDQSNACQFEAALRAIEDDTEDIDTTDHAYSYQVVAASPAGTAGEVSHDDITFTDGAQMDNVNTGDYFVFRLMRDVSDDSMTGDASVLAIHIKET